jgi:hypothetical protein
MTSSLGRRIAGPVAAALILAACGGGSDTVDAASWAADFCSALAKWQESVQESGSVLETGLDIDSDPATAKAALSGFADDVVADTDDLLDAMNEAGIPDVENGEEVSDALIAAFEDARAALVTARGDIDDMSTDSAQFESQADAIKVSVQSSLSDIGSDIGQKLDTLAPTELKEVFEETDCA